MVPKTGTQHRDGDSAPRYVCGPNLISDLIGESPIFSAASQEERNNVPLNFSIPCDELVSKFVDLELGPRSRIAKLCQI